MIRNSFPAQRIVQWRSHQSHQQITGWAFTPRWIFSAVASLWIFSLTAGPAFAQNSPSLSESKLEISKQSWADLMAMLPKYRGKVVVIDLWSTSCDPCLKEYPGILALQKKYPQEIVCVSMNCDYIGVKTKPVEYYRPRVVEFLQSQNSNIVHLMCNEPADELFEKLKLDSIPAVYVFDQQGQQVKRFDGQYTREVSNASATQSAGKAAADSEEDEEESKFSYAEDVAPVVEKLLKNDVSRSGDHH